MWVPSASGEDVSWTGARITKYRKVEKPNSLVDDGPGELSQPIKAEFADMYLWVPPLKQGAEDGEKGTSVKGEASEASMPTAPEDSAT